MEGLCSFMKQMTTADIRQASLHPMSRTLLEQEKGLSSFQKSPSEAQWSVMHRSRRYLQIGIR
jgi:hypothetical protein